MAHEWKRAARSGNKTWLPGCSSSREEGQGNQLSAFSGAIAFMAFTSELFISGNKLLQSFVDSVPAVVPTVPVTAKESSSSGYTAFLLSFAWVALLYYVLFFRYCINTRIVVAIPINLDYRVSCGIFCCVHGHDSYFLHSCIYNNMESGCGRCLGNSIFEQLHLLEWLVVASALPVVYFRTAFGKKAPCRVATTRVKSACSAGARIFSSVASPCRRSRRASFPQGRQW
jgi:hypothetical protein